MEIYGDIYIFSTAVKNLFNLHDKNVFIDDRPQTDT